MSLPSTVEAKTLFEAVVSLFGGKCGDFDGIDVHGVRVMGGGVGGNRVWG